MTEDFLHYVWKYQKFSRKQLTTVRGLPLKILKPGRHNHDAGPDFFFGEVTIKSRRWAGTIEVHKKASDWYVHKHDADRNYENVILHVVWEYDADIHRSDGSIIPTLELKNRVREELVDRYTQLMLAKQARFNCEDQFGSLDHTIFTHWMERMFFDRLEAKDAQLKSLLRALNYDWEAALFQLLFKSFGLKVNGASFLSIARSINYKLIRKYRSDPLQLEALIMGQSGLLEGEGKDDYHRELQDAYRWLSLKHKLSSKGVIQPVFLRLRPNNFPGLRMAQLVSLVHLRPHLFSECLYAKTPATLYAILGVSPGVYWNTHFTFGNPSKELEKPLSKSFKDLLIANAIVPIKYAFAQYTGKDWLEDILDLTQSIAAETNKRIAPFYAQRDIPKTVLESQALLQMRSEYCDKNRCIECGLGNEILGRSKMAHF